MIRLTTEQAQQIEEALVATTLNKDYWLEKCMDSLDTIRAARAREQAEQIAWPEQLEHPPMYPDENRETEYMAYQYRKGWNDCLARFKQSNWIKQTPMQIQTKQLDQADAPVRTKDLTDDEILSVPYWGTGNIPTSMVNFARAVIEKFKEKQK